MDGSIKGYSFGQLTKKFDLFKRRIFKMLTSTMQMKTLPEFVELDDGIFFPLISNETTVFDFIIFVSWAWMSSTRLFL